ncbi:MAG: hypothetical protein K0R03_387 [Moraxellaceae bacterium]|jgi:hypothetical protein|nr:hypothetical protein [Moraxellaceae bacterium]
MMKLRLLLATLLLCTSSLARAATSYTDATNYLLMLYGVCLGTVGNPSAIAAFFQEQGTEKLTWEQAAPFLGGNAGNVWPADTPFGQYMLAARNDGLCTVQARWADVQEVREAFFELVERLHQESGGKLVKASDATMEKGRQLVSFNLAPPALKGYHLNLSALTMESTSTDLQVVLAFKAVSGDMPAAKEADKKQK